MLKHREFFFFFFFFALRRVKARKGCERGKDRAREEKGGGQGREKGLRAD